MTNIRAINGTKKTPDEVLAECLAVSDELSDVLVITVRRVDDVIEYYHSDIADGLMALLSFALQSEIMRKMEE